MILGDQLFSLIENLLFLLLELSVIFFEAILSFVFRKVFLELNYLELLVKFLDPVDIL